MTPADSGMPKSKAELLEHIQREWTALWAVIDALNAEQMLQADAGGWSIKDNLAHLAEWERFIINNQFEGQAPAEAIKIEQVILEKLDEAGMNAVLLARNQARPLTDVLADLRQTHARLLAALDQTSDAALQKETRSIGPKSEAVMVWVVYNTYEHYAEHRQTITQNAKQRLS